MCLHHVLQFKIIIIEAKDSKMIKYQLNTNHSKIIKFYKFLKEIVLCYLWSDNYILTRDSFNDKNMHYLAEKMVGLNLCAWTDRY